MPLQRDESDRPEPLYTLKQVQEITGWSRTTIWQRLKRREFPEPAVRGRLLWRPGAINDWLSGSSGASPPRAAVTDVASVAAHAHPSIIQAIEADQFPAWFAELWTDNGFAEAYDCDQRWLQDFARRLQEALRGSQATREDRLQDLLRWLVKECRRKAHRRAAEFWLQWTAYLHMDAVHARFGPSWEGMQARAFGAAVALIRRARQDAQAAGVAADRLDTVDLQAIAEIVSREVLEGEGISRTDVLTAIKGYTAVIPLREWVGAAP